MSLLPPCRTALQRHIRQANCVTRLLRLSCENVIQVPGPSYHGWTKDNQIDWIDNSNTFSDDAFSMLLKRDSGDEYQEDDRSSE